MCGNIAASALAEHQYSEKRNGGGMPLPRSTAREHGSKPVYTDLHGALAVVGSAAALCGVVAILGWASTGAAQATFDGGQVAYVDTTALNLRADAGTKSAIVGILLKYDLITVFERKSVGASIWYGIEASGGYTNGWVSAAFVQFGSPPPGAAPEDGPVDYGAKRTPTLSDSSFQYVGPGKCAECHVDSTGSFHRGASQSWQQHVHAQAYNTLTREYTREISRRKRGIDDPADDWRCLKCHVTAYGAGRRQKASSYSDRDGVTCEVCHGPGGTYADAEHGPDNPNRETMGFRVLRDLGERREVCTSCHNPASPTYVPFNLREFSRSIAHWVDQSDEFYYPDAVSEADRRMRAVEARRAQAAAGQTRKREARLEAALAESQRDSQASEQERADAERRIAEEAAQEAAAERRRQQAAERAALEERRLQAEAALASNTKADRERELASVRKASEAQALGAAKSSSGAEQYLEDVDETIQMNMGGAKYEAVAFPHLAHASKRYLPNGTCNACHHSLEGDDVPEDCGGCHAGGGEAKEQQGKKKRYVHTKGLGYPREPRQKQTSCVGCHQTQNVALIGGQRGGDHAPTKCTACHTRRR